MPTRKLFGLVALVALAAPAAIAEEVVVRSSAIPTCAACEVIRTAPHRVVVVKTVTGPIPSDNLALPFVGAAPFVAGKALPQPFVGERPAVSVAARPYFGEPPAPQPPVDGMSVQIPAAPEKR